MLATAILAGTVLGCTNPGDPRFAHHDVALVGDRIAIETTWSAMFRDDPRLVLAVPLPPDATVTGAEVERGVAGITALVLADAHDPSVHVELDAAAVTSSGELPLPIACSTTMQRLRIGDDLSFRADTRLGVVVHLGRTQPADLSSREREAMDAMLPGQRTEIGAQYLPTSAIVEEGGVIGVVEHRADSKHKFAIGMGAVFVVLCGAGSVLYLRTRRAAEAEHAEAVLAAEFDALGSPTDGWAER
jgi:hypothetical protein